MDPATIFTVVTAVSLTTYALGAQYLRVLEMRTPAAIEREKQRGLTEQISMLKNTAMSSDDCRTAIERLTSLHRPDSDELNMRATIREMNS